MLCLQIEIDTSRTLACAGNEPPSARQRESLLKRCREFLEHCGGAAEPGNQSAKLYAQLWPRLIRHYRYQAGFALCQAVVVPGLVHGDVQLALMLFSDGRLARLGISGCRLNAGLLNHLASSYEAGNDWPAIAQKMRSLEADFQIEDSASPPSAKDYASWLDAWLDGQGLPASPERQIAVREFSDLLACFASHPLQILQDALDYSAWLQAQPSPTRRIALYNYLACAPENIRERRTQALRVLPVLQDIIEAGDDSEVAARYRPALAAIDQGQALFPALAAIWQVPLNVIRTLTLRRSETGSCTRLEQLVADLACIPPSLRPQRGEDFSPLLCMPLPDSVADLLFASSLSADENAQWAAARQRARSRWWPELARRAAASSWSTQQQWLLQQDQVTLVNFIEALARAIRPGRSTVLPVTIRLFDLVGLRALYRLAGRWQHQRFQLEQQQERQRSNALRAGAPWPALWKQPRCCGQRSVHPLLSAGELANEGERLQHCLASYTSAAARGDSFLFALRDSAGHSCSTLEIGFESPEDRIDLSRIVIRQHRGVRNGEPDSICLAAVQEILNRLRQGEIDQPLDSFQRRLQRCRLRHLALNPLAIAYFMGLQRDADTAGRLPQLADRIAAWREEIPAADSAIDPEVERLLKDLLSPC